MAQAKSQSGRRRTSEVRTTARAPRGKVQARPASRKAQTVPASGKAQTEPASRKAQTEPAPRQAQAQPASGATFEKSLVALANRASMGTRAKPGALVLQCTDSGDAYVVEGGAGAARVTRGAAGRGTPAAIRVAGPSAVLAAIIGGRQDAAAAFIRGGLQVSGDLDYLESVLKDLGLLNCP